MNERKSCSYYRCEEFCKFCVFVNTEKCPLSHVRKETLTDEEIGEYLETK